MPPSPNPPKHRRLVVTRFSKEAATAMPYEKDAQDKTDRQSIRDSWEGVRHQHPTATLEPLYPDGDPRGQQPAFPPDPNMPPPLPVIDPTTFFAVEVGDDDDPADLVNALQALPDTEATYLMDGPCPPPDFTPSDDTFFQYQGYLKPADRGIDMIYAQKFPGGDGQGVGFIDIEQGWVLDHEDLVASGAKLLSGVNQDFFGHGTAVLGQMVATDNKRGIVGIARGCRVNVVSQWQSPNRYRTDLAILEALKHLKRGDVLLLEAQVDRHGTFYPVEIEEAVLNALRIAYNAGVIVIEAAGNGGANLDAFGNGVLNRNHSHFRESGAILVGAASSNISHQPMSFSNFGSRIDCYGWGENIATTGDGQLSASLTTYTQDFGGTSGASPMIAGIAVIVQAIRQAKGLARLWPNQMRAFLSDPANGTPSANPAQDGIGVMPDLRKLIDRMLA